MSINYSLYENKLIAGGDSYAAHVNIKGSVGLEQIADRIVGMGTTVRKADILAVLENTCQACEEYLIEGNRVNVGDVFDLYPSIKGVFDSITDSFDPARHKIEVNAAPGTRVRKNVQESASVEKQQTILPIPTLLQFVDLGSGTVNTSITHDNIGTIHGHRLKFDPDDPTEGIFFVDNVGAETKVTAIQKNKPGELIFLNPTLSGPDGPYTLEVRAHFSTGGELRTGILDYELTALP